MENKWTCDDVDSTWMKTKRQKINYDSVYMMNGTNDKIKDLFHGSFDLTDAHAKMMQTQGDQASNDEYHRRSAPSHDKMDDFEALGDAHAKEMPMDLPEHLPLNEDNYLGNGYDDVDKRSYVDKYSDNEDSQGVAH